MSLGLVGFMFIRVQAQVYERGGVMFMAIGGGQRGRQQAGNRRAGNRQAVNLTACGAGNHAYWRGRRRRLCIQKITAEKRGGKNSAYRK